MKQQAPDRCSYTPKMLHKTENCFHRRPVRDGPDVSHIASARRCETAKNQSSVTRLEISFRLEGPEMVVRDPTFSIAEVTFHVKRLLPCTLTARTFLHEDPLDYNRRQHRFAFRINVALLANHFRAIVMTCGIEPFSEFKPATAL